MNLKAKLARAHRSWTLWFNGIALVFIQFVSYLQDSFPLLKTYVDPAMYSRVMLVIISVNILFRFKTTKSLADK